MIGASIARRPLQPTDGRRVLDGRSGDAAGYVRCAMESVTVPLVQGADDLTVEWCDAALAGTLGVGRVVAVRTEAVGTGQVADTVRIHLTYEPPGAGPATLVAKVPAAEETSRAGARLTGTYEIEASFYRDLAAGAAGAHAVLLPRGPRRGDQRLRRRCSRTSPRPCKATRWPGARSPTWRPPIDELVLLHGPRWGDPTLREIGWLHRNKPAAGRGHHRPDHLRRRSVQGALHRAPRRRHGGARRSARAAARRIPAPAAASRGPSSTATSGPTTCCSAASGSSSSTGRPSGSDRARPTSATCSGPASRPAARQAARGRPRRPLRRGAATPTASPSTGTACGSSTAGTPSVGWSWPSSPRRSCAAPTAATRCS